MSKKIEIRLSGSGGQGLITAGIILAHAASLDGLNVVQSQSYGPEARGGSSKSEVIISHDDIYYPKLIRTDILLCLTQLSYDTYEKDLKANGILILDDSIKYRDGDYKLYRASILSTATEKLNKSMVANIVALGLINKIIHIVSKDSLLEAVLSRVPKGTEDLNKKALEEGYLMI